MLCRCLIALLVAFFGTFINKAQAISCTNPNKPVGARNYNTSIDNYQMCTSYGWVVFLTSGISGTCSASEVAKMDFNSTENKYQYCDGTNWVQIGQGESCTVDSMRGCPPIR